MSPLRRVAYMILLLLVVLTLCLARSRDDVISAEQAKLFLLERMTTEFPEGSLLEAQGAMYFSTNDTILKANAMCQFIFDIKQLWHPQRTTIFGLSAITKNGMYPFPESLWSTVKLSSVDKIDELVTYPFTMASRRFVGYILEPRKMRTEVCGVKCIKIAVKPNRDENFEKAPLSGSVFLSDDDVHRVVRFEHKVTRSGVGQLVRWDFRDMGKFDFPYRVIISTNAMMCGFEMNSMIRIYFADIRQLVPYDTSETLPHLDITVPDEKRQKHGGYDAD